MLVICTVKIVSFLVIFNPVNFPFFFFFFQEAMGHLLCSSCSQVLLFLADTNSLCNSDSVIFCSAALQSCTAETLCSHPPACRAPSIYPCRREKSGRTEVHTTFLIIFYFRSPSVGAACHISFSKGEIVLEDEVLEAGP